MPDQNVAEHLPQQYETKDGSKQPKIAIHHKEQLTETSSIPGRDPSCGGIDRSNPHDSEKAIREFIQQYTAKYSTHERLAHETEKHCKKALEPGLGSKSLTMSRPKPKETIEDSIRRRLKDRLDWQPELGHFKDPEDIRLAMPDLAGVRIILAFPDDDAIVHELIQESFTQEKEPLFWGVYQDGRPRVEKMKDSNNRFLGYRATHYCVSPKDSATDTSLQAKRVEIQVTSMAMYAWQEVNHDLIYKTPKEQGHLTVEEKSSLDMVNGLVHANEIALNQFHTSLKRRQKMMTTNFLTENDLSVWLRNYIVNRFHQKDEQVAIKIVYLDLVFVTLNLCGICNPGKLKVLLDDQTKKITKEPISTISSLVIEIESFNANSDAQSSNIDYSVWVILKFCVRMSAFEDKSGTEELNEKAFILINMMIVSKAKTTKEDCLWHKETWEARRHAENLLTWLFETTGQAYGPTNGMSPQFIEEYWSHLLNDLGCNLSSGSTSTVWSKLTNLQIWDYMCFAIAALGIVAILESSDEGLNIKTPMFWPGTVSLHSQTRDIFFNMDVGVLIALIDGKWRRFVVSGPRWRYRRHESTPEVLDSLCGFSEDTYLYDVAWMPGHREYWNQARSSQQSLLPPTHKYDSDY